MIAKGFVLMFIKASERAHHMRRYVARLRDTRESLVQKIQEKDFDKYFINFKKGEQHSN